MTSHVSTLRAAAVALSAVVVVAGSARGGTGAERARTLVSTSAEIQTFAQDGDYLAWIAEGGRCEHRLHIRALGGSQSVTIDGVGCTGDQWDGLWDDEFALANGRALWNASAHGSNQQFGIQVQTAALDDPRVRRLPCCDMYIDESEDPPAFPLAGRAGMLVSYSHQDGGRPRDHSVRRVVGGKTQKVFDLEEPRHLAVDQGRIASVRRSRIKHCSCNFRPVWSPDGKRIAFLRTMGPAYDPFASGEFDPQRPAEIAIVNAGGGGMTVLTRNERHRTSLDWSPDGTRFVYAYDSGSGQTRIAMTKSDGSELGDVATGSEPEWSSSGSAIVFQSAGVVSVVNADGTGLRKLVRGEQPTWSPDGTRIAFIRGFLPGALYVMRADGTDVRRIAREEYPQNPTWSPDGRRLAYEAGRGIYTINADGTARRRLTTDGRDFSPDWSPDGRQLALSSSRDDLEPDNAEWESDLYVVGARDGRGFGALTGRGEWRAVGEVRSPSGLVLSRFAAKGNPLALALEGRLVVLATQLHAGPNRIVLFDAASGELRGLVRTPRGTGSGLGASASWVVYSVGRLIMALDVRTRARRVLARADGTPIGLSVSGRRVAWAENLAPRKARVRAVTLR